MGGSSNEGHYDTKKGRQVSPVTPCVEGVKCWSGLGELQTETSQGRHGLTQELKENINSG